MHRHDDSTHEQDSVLLMILSIIFPDVASGKLGKIRVLPIKGSGARLVSTAILENAEKVLYSRQCLFI